MENPWVSDAWEFEALEEVLLDPAMDFVRGDMCCWGKCDAVSGLPYSKPTGFAVNDMRPGSLMEAKVPIYGTGDAARGW